MSKSFCVLPWIHLASHPAGYVTLCCEADHTGLKSASYDITDPKIFDGQPSFYNLKYHTLDQVMNSQSFCDARLKMLNDEWPTPCLTCKHKEEQGVESKRQREARNFLHYTIETARSETAEDGVISPKLEFVELRLGNICNTRCITCNPLSSSQWRSDYLKLGEKFDFIRDQYQMMDKGRFVTWPTGFKDSNVFELDWPESEEFWDSLLLVGHELKVLYINGGEPTLIKRHWEFLENLVATGLSKNITLWYSLNMTNLPDTAIKIWSKFKKVRISCSIDDVFARNHYIRYPSSVEAVERNFVTLLHEQSKHNWLEVSITQTISAYNYYYLDEFYLHYVKQNNHLYIHYNFVSDPAYFSPAVLPLQLRKDINNRLARSIPHHLVSQCIKRFGSVEQDVANYEKFIAVTEELDKIRGTSFKDTFPELCQHLKY